MEMLAVLGGWIAVVGVVGVLVTRPWRAGPARALLPVALGLALAIWVLAGGYLTYRQLMSDGLWTAASVAIGYVPLKAIVLSLLAYAAGRSFLGARAQPGSAAIRWMLPAALAGVVVYAVASDIRTMHVATLERHAANPALSDAEVAALIERIRTGAAERGEISAFLGNPQCPPALLADYAASPEANWRAAVARNDAIDAALAATLAEDPEEEVRFMLAFNRKLPPAILSRLANDSSEYVRDTVVWTDGLPDEDFDRLVGDPSAKVRATAAIQSRVSEAQLEKLRADPEQRVRDAANRWGPAIE